MFQMRSTRGILSAMNSSANNTRQPPMIQGVLKNGKVARQCDPAYARDDPHGRHGAIDVEA